MPEIPVLILKAILFGTVVATVINIFRPKPNKNYTMISRKSLQTISEIGYLDGVNSGLSIAAKLLEGNREEAKELSRKLEEQYFERYEKRNDELYFNKL